MHEAEDLAQKMGGRTVVPEPVIGLLRIHDRKESAIAGPGSIVQSDGVWPDRHLSSPRAFTV